MKNIFSCIRMKTFMLSTLIISCVLAAVPSEDVERYKRDTQDDLLQAFKNKNEAEVGKLIENGANADFKDINKDTAMHYAARYGWTNIIQLLINKGFRQQIQQKNVYGGIPLHWAAETGHLNAVDFLLKSGSRIDEKLHIGDTPLWVAAHNGHLDTVKFLIEKGSEVDVKNNEGETPLYTASHHNHLDTVSYLIEKGANINQKKNRGWNSLIVTAEEGYLNVVRLLIQKGANINVKTDGGRSPLNQAAYGGHPEVAKFLIENGADVNIKTNDGNTPLMQAAEKGFENVAEVLYRNGADIHAKNNAGEEARDIATKGGHKKFIEWLDSVDKSLPINRVKKACAKYSVREPTDFIHKGQRAETDFPWMAALNYLNSDSGDSISFKCAGTIISEKFILTAAHCVPEDNPPIVIRVGILNLGVETINNYFIKEIVRHENYSKELKKNDMALIRLYKEIKFTPNIRPACLETETKDLSAHVRLNVTGWGRTSKLNESVSHHLLTAESQTVPLSKCNEIFLKYNEQAQTEVLRNGISESQYCAGSPNGGGNNCEGDSGGPLQVFRNPFTAHVVGIVSFGIGCGSEYPDIHTRVSYYLDWIAGHVWP